MRLSQRIGPERFAALRPHGRLVLQRRAVPVAGGLAFPRGQTGNLDHGDYAVEMKAEPPSRFSGIFPVLLDEASLLFASRRAEKQTWLPEEGKRYFDKISLRQNFDPRDEYLCLEGTSFFSHGHHDGNTVTRLTWKDRIWLFDLNYIDFTPRNHNGVVAVFNGIQSDPPPVNSLDCSADFGEVGLLKTTSGITTGPTGKGHRLEKREVFSLPGPGDGAGGRGLPL